MKTNLTLPMGTLRRRRRGRKQDLNLNSKSVWREENEDAFVVVVVVVVVPLIRACVLYSTAASAVTCRNKLVDKIRRKYAGGCGGVRKLNYRRSWRERDEPTIYHNDVEEEEEYVDYPNK